MFSYFAALFNKKNRPIRKTPTRFRPLVETLEDRVVPTTVSPPLISSGYDSGVFGDNITNSRQPEFQATVYDVRNGLQIASFVLPDVAAADIPGFIYVGPSASQVVTSSFQYFSGDLEDGAYTVLVIASDTAESSAQNSSTFYIDTTAPEAPTTPNLLSTSDSGNSSDNITNDTSPTFSVTLNDSSPGTTYIRLYFGGNLVANVPATGGTQNITANLSGLTGLFGSPQNVTARAVDAAGNSSGFSSSLSVTIDTTAAAPSTPDLASGSDSGNNTDNTTNDNTPTFTGTAEAGSTVRIFSDGNEVGSGTATGGNYSIVVSTLAPGTRSITANITDIAGNNSALSGSLSVIIDITAAAPSTPDLASGSDNGSSNSDNITSITTPTFTGTAEAGSTVRIFSDGNQVGSGTATGGNYSIVVSSLTPGTRSITANMTDIAGNNSTTSGALSIIIDTPPILAGMAANQAVNDNATVSPFSTLTITDPDNQSMLVTVTIQSGTTRGDFTSASSSGWTRSVSSGNIIYTRTFTGANIGSLAQAGVRALVFDPRENAITPNTTEKTIFDLTVNDGLDNFSNGSEISTVTTSINDAPTLANITALTAITDKQTATPFSNVSIGDVDNPAQTQTVQVTLDNPAKGTLAGTGFTETGLNTGIYTFTGTAAAAQTAIRALVFTPTENRVAPTTTEETTFTITVNDGLAPTVSNYLTVVRTESINDTPVLGGITAETAIDDKQTATPFTTVTITDADSDASPSVQDVTVTVTLDNAAKGALAGSGFTETGMNTGIYTFTGTAAAAQTAIRTLVFTPTENRVAPTTVEQTIFAISVNDGLAPAVIDSDTVVSTTSVNDAPLLGGITPLTTTNDKSTASPFTTVTITDADSDTSPSVQDVTVTVTLDLAAKGTLTNLAGFAQGPAGTYSFTGTAANAQTALRGLVFVPTPDRVAPPTTEDTTFTITLNDGLAPAVVDDDTVVRTTSVNDAPRLGDIRPLTSINDKSTATPFRTVTISDADSDASPSVQNVTVTITLDNGAKGTLENSGGFSHPTADVYIFIGTAAEARAAVRALVFVPTENRVAPTTRENTNFTIRVDDGIASVSNNLTVVRTTSINDAPVISGITALTQIDDKHTAMPFTAVTIADADSDASPSVQDVTVTVRLDVPAKGRLAGTGFTQSAPGVYNFTGTAAEAQANIRTLVFTPTENRRRHGLTEDTRFTIRVGDTFTAVSNNNTIVRTLSVNDPPNRVAGKVYNTVMNLPFAPSSLIVGALNGLLARTTDPENDVLQVRNVTPPPIGRLSFNAATGAFVYTPQLKFLGQVTFTYRTFDGELFSDLITVTINVRTPTGVPATRVG